MDCFATDGPALREIRRLYTSAGPLPVHGGCTGCLAHSPGPFASVAQLVLAELDMLFVRREHSGKPDFDHIWSIIISLDSLEHDPNDTVESNIVRAWLRNTPSVLREWLSRTRNDKLHFANLEAFVAYRQMSLDPFLDVGWHMSVKPDNKFDSTHAGCDSSKWDRKPAQHHALAARMALNLIAVTVCNRSSGLLQLQLCDEMLFDLARGASDGDLAGITTLEELGYMASMVKGAIKELEGGRTSPKK